jgi:hypothetical protein
MKVIFILEGINAEMRITGNKKPAPHPVRDGKIFWCTVLAIYLKQLVTNILNNSCTIIS